MPDDREKVIRHHFEVMRDLTWMDELEPKCRAEGMNAERITSLRAAWNQFSETRDWEWWQKNAARESNERLLADITEAVVKMNDLTQYRQKLAEASRPPANNNDKGIDR